MQNAGKEFKLILWITKNKAMKNVKIKLTKKKYF